MIKKLGGLLVLCALIVVGLKGYTSYAAMQFLEAIKQEHGKHIALSYGWLHSDLDGNIYVEEIEFTPFALKRPIKIETLTFKFGGISSMLGSLEEIRSGRLASPLTIQYSGAQIPLKGRGFVEWLSLYAGDKLLVPLNLYDCAPHTRIDFSAMKAMGIDEILVSGSLALEHEGAKDQLKFIADIDKIGRMNVSLDMDLGRVNSIISEGDTEGLSLSSIDFSYQDSGYYRRLVNLCTQKNGLDSEVYANLSAKDWSKSFADIGIVFNEGVQNLYRDRMLQGGVISIKAFPKDPISLNGIESLYDQDLVSSLGLVAVLNGENRMGLSAYLDGSYYRPKQPVEEKDESQQGLQATVVLGNVGFKMTELSALSEHIGRKIRVRLKDGKDYQGLLKSSDEYKIEVTLILGGGTADYFFANDKVELVEVWR